MTKTILNKKKIFLITIMASLCLILFQATSAYANGQLGQIFDDGNTDGTATYDISHLNLDENNCITDTDVSDPFVTPFYMESFGNVSTSADPKLGDENTYVFSNDEYFDINNVSLNCGKVLFAYLKKDHYIPYISLSYNNNFNGHELKNDIKYHVTGTITMKFDGHEEVTDQIDCEIRRDTHYGEWTDQPGFITKDGYHNQILWTPNLHPEFESCFDAVGRNGMANLIKAGKFQVHLKTITCTVVEN